MVACFALLIPTMKSGLQSITGACTETKCMSIKRIQRREASFTLYFRHWLKANPMPSSAFELKQSVTESLSFDAVKQHQLDFLLACTKSHGFLYKIPDDSRGIKPFDMVNLTLAYAWVVIRYPHNFHIISIETFLLEKSRSKRKSLTSMRAREISTYSIDLYKK